MSSRSNLITQVVKTVPKDGIIHLSRRNLVDNVTHDQMHRTGFHSCSSACVLSPLL